MMTQGEAVSPLWVFIPKISKVITVNTGKIIKVTHSATEIEFWLRRLCRSLRRIKVVKNSTVLEIKAIAINMLREA